MVFLFGLLLVCVDLGLVEWVLINLFDNVLWYVFDGG